MSVNSLSLHFLREHPKDAARTLEQFDPASLAHYLEQAPDQVAAEVIKYIIPSIATECLKAMPLEQSAPIVMHLGVERAAKLLRRMQEGIREQFITATSPIFSNMTRLVLRYPEGTVGQTMNPNVFTVHQDMTVAEVVIAIRNSPELTHNEIFVTGNQQRLSGVVDVRQLLLSDGKQVMKDIMRPPGDSFSARSSLVSVRHYVERDPRENFPVVDHQGAFIGVFNRTTLHEVLSGKTVTGHEGEYTGTALAVAELFWEACANMLAPGHDNRSKGHQNERND